MWWESNIELYSNAEMYLIKNTVEQKGGAIAMVGSSSFTTKYAVLHLITNSASSSGVILIQRSMSHLYQQL